MKNPTNQGDESPGTPPADGEPATRPPAEPEDRRLFATTPATRRLIPLFLAVGACLLTFALLTVHHRNPEQLVVHPESKRSMYSITYWIENGYFAAGGLAVRTWADSPPYFYRSSTGGHLISALLAQKVWKGFTGNTSWRLTAVHNQVVTMLIGVSFALLGFRLATRCGATPLQALLLAISVQAAIFTFPDNLARYWELTGREYFLLFAAIFLLLEERRLERPSRALAIAQGASAFLLTYMEYMSGFLFLFSFTIASVALAGRVSTLKRVGLICWLPALLAVSVFATQLAVARAYSPDIPIAGSEFLFRTGLDGDSRWYVGHLDIAFGRDVARLNFPANRESLFHWPYFFVAGSIAFLGVMIAAAVRRAPSFAVLALVSLLGTYLLHGAVFSQSVAIHPYLYDTLLFVPLALALLVAAPSLLESVTRRGGIIVVAVFFLAIWTSMSQLRDYVLRFPPDPPVEQSHKPFVPAGTTASAEQAEKTA